jgi:hypothetical protein
MAAIFTPDGRRGYDYSGVDGQGLDTPMTHTAADSIRAKVADSAAAAIHNGMTFDKSERILTFWAMRFTGDKPDRVGDVISPDAPVNWLKNWERNPMAMYPSSSGRLPIVFGHNWTDADQLIGWAEPQDCTITAEGLLIAAHLFPTKTAEHVWNVANEQGMGASFSFEITKGGEHRDARRGFNVIDQFKDIMEAGPCLLGAEPTAGTVSVKSFEGIVAQWKRLELEVAERHPEVLIADIQRSYDKAMAKQAAKKKAAKSDPTRCACGAYLKDPFASVTIEGEDGVGQVSTLGHVSWRTCSRCGLMDLRTESKALRAQNPNDIARIIKADLPERAARSKRKRDAANAEFWTWTPEKRAAFTAKAEGDPSLRYVGVQAEAKQWLAELDESPTAAVGDRANIADELDAIEAFLKETA